LIIENSSVFSQQPGAGQWIRVPTPRFYTGLQEILSYAGLRFREK
jgi:hypothetical protein